jgi:hypothetical protein
MDGPATTERTPALAGGCQCGAVRYALYAQPVRGNICHCGMCRKASGNYFAAFTGVKLENFAWTKGEPAVFRSSVLAERGFCRDCGTPLFFRYVETNRIAVTIGSLDDPAAAGLPEKQYGVEGRLPAFFALASLPEETTDEALPAAWREKLAASRPPQQE